MNENNFLGGPLSFKIKNCEYKNPIFTGSGTYGYSTAYKDFYDVSSLGAIVTKAITMEPRPGNDGQRIFETASGMINRIGLENIGIEKFVSEKLPGLHKAKINFIVNIAGSTSDDYLALAEIAQREKFPAIEINVSCPNVKSGCIEFGTDAKILYELVKAIRARYDGCLIIKLSPNVTAIDELGMACQNAGADALTAINTVRGLGIKLKLHNKKFTKTVVQGGLSGQAIKPVALACVNKLYSAVTIPIIASGGVYNYQDVLEFFAVGAQAVQIGTANFTYQKAAKTILDELTQFMQENEFTHLAELQKSLREAE